MGSNAKNVKPGYTNPAFRMMGIPPLKFPSRNWMVFWSVLTVSVSGIVYDKQKQKQIRSHYRDVVQHLSSGNLDVNRKPRKITVFIAPPPSDYLDTSLKVWRRYVKPILYYAGLDYEVIEEEKQGVIRTEVANRIRELRRQLKQAECTGGNNSRNDVVGSQDENEFDAELAKKFKNEFDYRDVMGIFYKTPKPTVICEDSLNPDPSLAGGVICLGRGAYKEYIAGLHEGMLGPLDPPGLPEDKPRIEEIKEPLQEGDDGSSKAKIEEKPETVDSSEGESEDKANDKKVLKPFISPGDYSSVEFPIELSSNHGDSIIRDPATSVPVLFHQAVLMIPIPNLIGFLTIPERIYRFYQKRCYAESVCSAVADLAEQKGIRPFEHQDDLKLGEEEEDDWPKSWVKEGEKRKSEWTRELKDDPRVVEYIKVYNKPMGGSKNN